MSCYNSLPPNPTREWTRVENRCLTDNSTISPSEALLDAMQYKGNILQYKNNSANLTKNQKYALIAQGKWLLRNKTYATQSETYSNPNTNTLNRINSTNIDTNNGNQETTEPPSSCNTSPIAQTSDLPEVLSNSTTTPPVIPPIPPIPLTIISLANVALLNDGGAGSNVSNIITNGGTLICNQQQNPCTGKITTTAQSNYCYSTTFSNVPYGNVLCYNTELLYYPRKRYTMNNSANKWPNGSNFIR
jgi:hypothetical protein